MDLITNYKYKKWYQDMKSNITIIGTGICRDDISPKSMRAIEDADMLIGGRRQLGFFSEHPAKKIELTKNATEIIKKLKRQLRGERVAVLASGDPNFFGIAALFYTMFKKHTITVIPNTTAFQQAFARIKESWHDATFISVHGREMYLLDDIIHGKGKFIIYCDDKNSPAKVSQYLITKDGSLGLCNCWIFDSLGSVHEKILKGPLKRFQKLSSTAQVMMVIQKKQQTEVHPVGIPDHEFYHQRGMITKRDIRVMALARLCLKRDLVLWDIGAGSGSLAVEAANLYRSVQVYAIEEQQARFKELQKNVQKFKVPTVKTIKGTAPEALQGLPRPDRIFIGGSGGRLNEILHTVKKQMDDDGHIVINCVTLETMTILQKVFKRWHWPYDITSVQLSHLASGAKPEMYRAENPVFIVHATKGKKVKRRKGE